jgi:hypothetical protein
MVLVGGKRTSVGNPGLCPTWAACTALVAWLGVPVGLLLLTPVFFVWGKPTLPDSSPTEASLAAAQALELKLRLLSGSDEKAPKSFQPVVITEGEANSYLKYRGQEFLPAGVHDAVIHITPERVLGAADVDFNEFSRTYSSTSEWGPKVLAMMFKGKQKVTAAGKLETQNGLGKVKIETMAIGTTAVPDWLVDFMLQNYLQPRYKFDLSKPFELPDHVTRIELGLGQATFYRAIGPLSH